MGRQTNAGCDNPRPRCLIIGQHRLLIECLHLLLESELEIFSVAPTNAAALDFARQSDPQLVIVQGNSSSDDALKLVSQLREDRPDLAVTILVDEADPPTPQQTSWERYFCATELVRGLRKKVEPIVTHAQGITTPSQQPGAQVKLSQRELEVLILLVRGLRMKEVARRLGISPRTVAFHKYRAMESNQLRTQADLLEFALRHGLLSGEPPRRLRPVLMPLLRSAGNTLRNDKSVISSLAADDNCNNL